MLPQSQPRYRPLSNQDRPRPTTTAEGGDKTAYQDTQDPHEQPPVKAIVLAVVLLCVGIVLLILGGLHLQGHIYSKDGAGWGLVILGVLTFLPAISTRSQPVFDYNKLWTEAQSYHGVQAIDAVADKHVTMGVVLAAKGFHSQIQFTLDAQQARDHDICQMTVLQALPAGVYADPYELANIAGMSGTQSKLQLQLASYHVFGKVDVERIEPDCEPTLLSVSANINASQMQPASARKLEALRLSVPLHARYPAPHTGRSADSFAAASHHHYSIDNPILTLRCFNKATYQVQDTARVCQDVCQISSVHHNLQWTVPAGLTKHAKFTQIITFAVAVGSLFALLIAVFTGAQSRGVLNVSKQQ